MRTEPLASAREISALHSMYPCALAVREGALRFEVETATTYGYVPDGSTLRLGLAAFDATLRAGAFFTVPGRFEGHAEGPVVTIVRHGFLGLPQVGSIEARGRLAYIDGCSDTVLVAPPRQGDPVLNHLHFPAGIRQTTHTHPSVRLGVVARGRGFAILGEEEIELSPGDVFAIESHEAHAFRTGASSMDVIAFHPDSDWGPTDGAHPMLNRTYLRR